MSVILHPQLANDCFEMGYVNTSLLLLHKNALIPWFILVPDTTENELYKLPPDQQTSISKETVSIARFTEQHFKADKLNIATIGNIVPQLHIHIIARHKHDFCWPNPVWGQSESSEYPDNDVQSLKLELITHKLICETAR